MPILKGNSKSHRVSVQNRNLISLPKEIREALKIDIGDVLDVRIEGNKIVIEPFKLAPSSQAYFWADNTQKDLLEAKEDVDAGRVRNFTNVDDFMDGLDDND